MSAKHHSHLQVDLPLLWNAGYKAKAYLFTRTLQYFGIKSSWFDLICQTENQISFAHSEAGAYHSWEFKRNLPQWRERLAPSPVLLLLWRWSITRKLCKHWSCKHIFMHRSWVPLGRFMSAWETSPGNQITLEQLAKEAGSVQEAWWASQLGDVWRYPAGQGKVVVVQCFTLGLGFVLAFVSNQLA